MSVTTQNSTKHRILLLWSLLLSIVVTGHCIAAEIYRCEINGKIVFTDEACDGEPVELGPINSLPAVEIVPIAEKEKPKYSSSKWYVNANGYRRALKVSREYDAPIFIYYQADWCGYCRKLEKNLLDKSKAKRALRSMVKVKITPEEGDREKTLFKKMGGSGYPTIMIQKNADGRPAKQRLTRRTNGRWSTLSLKEFQQLIDKFTIKPELSKPLL